MSSYNNYNPDFLNVLIEQPTDVQFQSLFLTNLYHKGDSRYICGFYQKMSDDAQQQIFLSRCFHLIIQQQAISDNFEVRHAAHRNIHTVFRELLNNANNSDDQMASLIQALTNGIITYVNNANSTKNIFDLSIDMRRIVWLLLQSDSLITLTEY